MKMATQATKDYNNDDESSTDDDESYTYHGTDSEVSDIQSDAEDNGGAAKLKGDLDDFSDYFGETNTGDKLNSSDSDWFEKEESDTEKNTVTSYENPNPEDVIEVGTCVTVKEGRMLYKEPGWVGHLDQEENACTLTLGEQRFLVDFVRAVYNPEDIRDLNPQLYPEIKEMYNKMDSKTKYVVVGLGSQPHVSLYNTKKSSVNKDQRDYKRNRSKFPLDIGFRSYGPASNFQFNVIEKYDTNDVVILMNTALDKKQTFYYAKQKDIQVVNEKWDVIINFGENSQRLPTTLDTAKLDEVIDPDSRKLRICELPRRNVKLCFKHDDKFICLAHVPNWIQYDGKNYIVVSKSKYPGSSYILIPSSEDTNVYEVKTAGVLYYDLYKQFENALKFITTDNFRFVSSNNYNFQIRVHDDRYYFYKPMPNLLQPRHNFKPGDIVKYIDDDIDETGPRQVFGYRVVSLHGEYGIVCMKQIYKLNKRSKRRKKQLENVNLNVLDGLKHMADARDMKKVEPAIRLTEEKDQWWRQQILFIEQFYNRETTGRFQHFGSWANKMVVMSTFKDSSGKLFYLVHYRLLKNLYSWKEMSWDGTSAWERPTGYTKIRDHAYVRRRLRKIGSVSCYELISEDDIDSIRYKITKAEDLNEREQEDKEFSGILEDRYMQNLNLRF